MRTKSKESKQTQVIAPARLTPREASGNTASILAVAAALVGVLFWRARRSLKQGSGQRTYRAAKVLKSPPSKTQGGRRVNNKKKSKSQKQIDAKQTKSKKTESRAQNQDGESVLYTNHRYFHNTNGAAVPLAAPTSQPKG